MSEIASLLQQLGKRYDFSAGPGFVETTLRGVRFFWATEPVERTPLLYDAGIVIIGQGYKVGYLGEDQFRYDENHYLILSVPMPIECETHASPDEPLLGVFVDIDVASLHDLITSIGRYRDDSFDPKDVPLGVEPVPLDPDMLAATERLLKCLCSDVDTEVLGPMIVKEITYRALLGQHAHALYALSRHDADYTRISRVLTNIHQDCAVPLSIESMAQDARCPKEIVPCP